jgi:hypothetical protein
MARYSLVIEKSVRAKAAAYTLSQIKEIAFSDCKEVDPVKRG